MTAAEYEAAGLYDPNAPNAAERLAFLDWLTAQGLTIDQLVVAERDDALSGLVADRQLRPGPRFTARQVAERHGLPVEEVLALSLAVGLPPRDADDPIYSEDDSITFQSYDTGTDLFGAESAKRFVRIVGSSCARIAEAAVTMFQVQIEGPLRAQGGTDLEVARANMRAIATLEQVRHMLQVLFSGHMERAIRRLRDARPRRTVDTATLAVGFVDLVGFTTLAQGMSPKELAAVIERFEETAYDVATERDGRVVKLIGDEVMFVAIDPVNACDIALTLFERFEKDPAVTPRGGLAYGELLLRGGDYYGPIANLAARVAQIAVPNELLTTAAMVDAIAGAPFVIEPAGKRMLKGFDEPVPLASVGRRSS